MEKKSPNISLQANRHQTPHSSSKEHFYELFGFHVRELSSWSSLVKLLCKPSDPASLGVLRAAFGLLMALDVFQERGLSHADLHWGDPEQCRFPLFSFLKPLPLEWMYVVYLVMLIGALGITLGFLYRLSCLMFVVSYWYILLLNKTVWNNHSYLYGLIGILLMTMDANRYWSLDGLLFPRKRHAHVPLWNYTLLRFQIFLVYFVAGLKKLDWDWVMGYPMHYTARHWVFSPFRMLLTEDQVKLYIIHLGGLTLDISVGFLLFFDKTRKTAFLFGTMFHLMNSQLFQIGMFPWTMIATGPLFCYFDWPRKVFHNFPSWMRWLTPAQLDLQTSSHCLYDKDTTEKQQKKEKKKDLIHNKNVVPTGPGRRHELAVIVTGLYIITQCILPYSHGITKGYNNWTNGLYGYSWDMMIHAWDIQHVRITYIDQSTGTDEYLDPTAWTGNSVRWSSHADMVKQYGMCIKDRLAFYNITDIRLYFDIWMSLNRRFKQRMFDPRVDIIKADWSPFEKTHWILPLLVDLSDWREKLEDIERDLESSVSQAEVVFVADFPGLHLENFIPEELGNSSVTVLQGEVMVELSDKGENHTLTKGGFLQLPAGQFHNVHTVSDEPSCYMYLFVNTTAQMIEETLGKYNLIKNGKFTGSVSEAEQVVWEVENGPLKDSYNTVQAEINVIAEKEKETVWVKVSQLVTRNVRPFTRSIKFLIGAITSIVTRRPFVDFLNQTYTAEFQMSN